MSQPLRILFMGTPEFSVPTLRALADSPHSIVAVLTNPDRAAGRGKSLTPPPVKEAAEALGLSVLQPEKIRNNHDLYRQLKGLQPDVAVVVAYGQILPKRFLDLPTYGCLNIHASLLPSYRGASPINAALIHGETESGVTIMQMEVGLDTGPMLDRSVVEIPPNMNAQELHDELSQLGGRRIVDVVERWCRGEIEAVPQEDALSSYAPMMQKSDGKIDWSTCATTIHNLVRGVHPWPGAFSYYESKKGKRLQVKIHRTRVASDLEVEECRTNTLMTDKSPGALLFPNRDTLMVCCGEGMVIVEELQVAGKKAMTPREFINGFQPDDHSLFYDSCSD